jgi:hypothetical protein
MRRFLLTVATAATAASALAIAGCGDITGTRSVEGVYELRTVNGLSLPVTLNDGITVVAGEIELDSDGQFVDTFQYRDFNSPLVQGQPVFGTWTRSGNEIQFETEDGDFYTMTWSNGRLVQDTNSGNRYVYQR